MLLLYFFGDDAPICSAGAWNYFSSSDGFAGAQSLTLSPIPNHVHLSASCWGSVSGFQPCRTERSSVEQTHGYSIIVPGPHRLVRSRAQGRGTRFYLSSLSIPSEHELLTVKSGIILPLPY